MVLRRKLAVLLAAVMILVMASPALADHSNGKGIGNGVGGGNIANTDNGKRVANGGGQSNNPNVDGGHGHS